MKVFDYSILADILTVLGSIGLIIAVLGFIFMGPILRIYKALAERGQ
jgi:hypothetical protein